MAVLTYARQLPNKGAIQALMHPLSGFPFISFSQNKNGTVSMYVTSQWIFKNDRSRQPTRPIFLMMLADGKIEQRDNDNFGKATNSNWSNYMALTKTKDFFKPLEAHKIMEADSPEVIAKKKKDAEIINPFNGVIATGGMTSTYVPTKTLNKTDYAEFYTLAQKVYSTLITKNPESREAMEGTRQLMAVQERFIRKALEKGGIQESHVWYVEPSGLTPIRVLSSDDVSRNRMLNFDDYTNPDKTNLPLIFPAAVNQWCVNMAVDMSVSHGKSSTNQDMIYGVSNIDKTQNRVRERFMREAITTDGQGKEQRIIAEHIDANYGGKSRAAQIEQQVTVNNQIFGLGQLILHPMYNDSDSLASRFTCRFDQWSIADSRQHTEEQQNTFVPDEEFNMVKPTEMTDEELEEFLSLDVSSLMQIGGQGKVRAKVGDNNGNDEGNDSKKKDEKVDETNYADDDLPF